MKLNLLLKNAMIGVIVLFCAVYSSILLAYSKEEIDDHMRQNGFPNSNYPYYENANGCQQFPPTLKYLYNHALVK